MQLFGMAKRRIAFPLLWFLVTCLLIEEKALATKKLRIVYLGAHPHTRETIHLIDHNSIINDHHELLGSVLGSKDKAKEAMVRSSTKFINAFGAVLDDDEAANLKKHERVVSVFPSRMLRRHSTNAYAYLGLEGKDGSLPMESLWKKTNYGEDVIIGVLDSGIWPEAASLHDEGYGPVPSRFKGTCQPEGGVTCNRKLIGAQYFLEGDIQAAKDNNWEFKNEWLTARDLGGHGTEASISSSGNFVHNKSVLLNVTGTQTAKGSAPRARLSAYKMTEKGWGDLGFLLSMDAAIHDGVDLIHCSWGFIDGWGYMDDAMAMGTLHAAFHNVPVVTTAGNDYSYGTMSNGYPWVITAGAASTDRNIVTEIVLGNNKVLRGIGLSTGELPEFVEMIDGEDAMQDHLKGGKWGDTLLIEGKQCNIFAMDRNKVQGKVLVCYTDSWDANGYFSLHNSSAAGVIFYVKNDTETVWPKTHVLPAVQLRLEESQEFLSYFSSEKSPKVKIRATKVEFDTESTPISWAYVSKGPSNETAAIIKPDVAGPSPIFTEGIPSDNTKREPGDFRLIYGTSFSGPCLAGMAALVTKLHPDWTPSEIKSALMTTATEIRESETLDARCGFHASADALPTPPERMKANPFMSGSGMVNPNKATDPGLVYKTEFEEYLLFLCAKGYGSVAIANFTHGDRPGFKCPPNPPKIHDMNYPSIGLTDLADTPITVTRRVKNVGENAKVKYTVDVQEPKGISVAVNPPTLEFDKVGEEKVFTITFALQDRNAMEDAAWETPSGFVFGSLKWTDGEHHVKSPIAVHVAGMHVVDTVARDQPVKFMEKKKAWLEQKKKGKQGDSDL